MIFINSLFNLWMVIQGLDNAGIINDLFHSKSCLISHSHVWCQLIPISNVTDEAKRLTRVKASDIYYFSTFSMSFLFVSIDIVNLSDLQICGSHCHTFESKLLWGLMISLMACSIYRVSHSEVWKVALRDRRIHILLNHDASF